MRLALKAKCIIFNKRNPIYDSAIIVNNEKIEKILPNKEVNTKTYKVINLENCVLSPGFINAHIHLELGWIKKEILPSNSFTDWLSQIIEIKKRGYRKKEVIASTKNALIESINSGVTTVGEISSYDGADLNEIEKSAIRTVYFLEISNSTISRMKSVFLQELIKRSQKNDMFNLRLFPHSIYSLDTKLLKEIFDISKEKKIKLGIHLSESTDEVRLISNKKNNFTDFIFPNLPKPTKIESKKDSPLLYIENLNKRNIFNTLVHMNNLSNRDLKLISRKNLPIVLCPRSNLFLNQKLPNLNFFLKYEKVGLGTDGLSSNFSINFLDEIKFLYLNSKEFIKKDCEKIVLQKATLGGAKALGIDKTVGSIKINKKADIVAFKMKNSNPYMSIIDSNKNDLVMSMINGSIVRLR
ncbi:MAG: amidohydrolase family protein [Thermodesulfobacteriota bacterium]|nr:amidohydrolase family protein [Thermodesulfobacteriota bacterium]